MSTEQTATVEQRAAKHAALADASRLRIVDLLTLDDLSPSEIGAALDLPSNLVTHHLRALEAVGMVTRSRSEADKRRSYVRLTGTALEGLAPGRVERASRVVFVSTTNSARSQLAAVLWSARSSIPAVSGGTHPAARISSRAIAAADRHALALPNQPPRALQSVLTGTEFMVTVCDKAHEELGSMSDLHWSIPDPGRVGTDDAFDAVFNELDRRVMKLARHLALR